MSKTAKDLVNVIKDLIGNRDAMMATVTSIDKDNNTCEVSIDENELGAVRLQAIVKADQKGFRLYPAEGSKVIIERMNERGDWMVTLFSTIEEVVIEIGDATLRMNADGLVISKGDDDLKHVLKLIIQAVQQMMILYGNNADFVKLQQASDMTDNIFG
jgi:hypothetical protein